MRLMMNSRWGAIPAVLLLWAILLLGAPSATHAAGYSGYFYPSGTGTTACSPLCFGARASVTMPTPVYSGWDAESQNNSSIWIGISGVGSGHGTQCTLGSGNNNPLMQFGVNPFILSTGAISYSTWYEEYPCNNITNYGSLTINPGDVVTFELLCITNCVVSGDATSVWRMTWTNETTGSSITRTDTNWRVYPEHVDIVIEPQSTAVNSAVNQPLHFTTPMRVANVQVYQSGAWGPMSVPGESPPSKLQFGNKQISNTSNPRGAPYNINVMHRYGVSAPIDSPTGPHFIICSEIVQNTISTRPSACGYGPYDGSNGYGD